MAVFLALKFRISGNQRVVIADPTGKCEQLLCRTWQWMQDAGGSHQDQAAAVPRLRVAGQHARSLPCAPPYVRCNAPANMSRTPVGPDDTGTQMPACVEIRAFPVSPAACIHAGFTGSVSMHEPTMLVPPARLVTVRLTLWCCCSGGAR